MANSTYIIPNVASLVEVTNYASGIETMRQAMVTGGDTTAVTAYASGINGQLILVQQHLSEVESYASGTAGTGGGDATAVTTYASGINAQVINIQNEQTTFNTNITNYASGTNAQLTLVQNEQTTVNVNITNYSSGINAQVINIQNNQTTINTSTASTVSGINTSVINVTSYASGTKTLVDTLQGNQTASNSTVSGINSSLINVTNYSSGVNAQVINIQNAQTTFNTNISNFGSGVNNTGINTQQRTTILETLISGIDYHSAGVVLKPNIFDTGSGSVTIGLGEYQLFRDTQFSTPLTKYILSGDTFALTDQTNNYIIATCSPTPQVTVTTDRALINQSCVIPIYTIYREGTELHILDWDRLGKGLCNKLSDRLVRTERFTREGSGLILNEAATRLVTISDGLVWYGATPQYLSGCSSDTDQCELWYHSGGSWTHSDVTQYNNTQYDNGTNLTDLDANKYGVNWIFRGVEYAKHIFIVLGRDSYKAGDAEASSLPDTPPIIQSQCMLVGRIIVQKSEDTAYAIQSAFTTPFNRTPVVEHNDLLNIDGGQTNEYYHLTAAEHTATQNLPSYASGIRTTQITLQNSFGSTISGLTTDVREIESYCSGNKVLLLNHADQHREGGTDELSANPFNGFVNRTDSTITVSGNGIIITPITAFTVYSDGHRFIKSTVQSVPVVENNTQHYIYFDTNGDIQVSTTMWNINSDAIPAATAYKSGPVIAPCEERHGYKRNRSWHEWAHDTIGCRYESGFGGSFTNTSFSIGSGELHDEDIELSVTAKTSGRLWYRTDAGAKMAFASGTTTVPYALITGAINYDSTGVLTPVDNSKFVCNYIYATNDILMPIYIVVGQTQYSTVATARNDSPPALANVLTAEWKLLYRVIYQNQGGTPTYIEAADYRQVSTGPASTLISTDHSTLTNRAAANSHPVEAISGLDEYLSGTKVLNVLNQTNITNVTAYASGTKTLVDTLQVNQTSNTNTISGINSSLINVTNYASGVETLRRAMVTSSATVDKVELTVTQNGHGFTSGVWLYRATDSTYKLAKADAEGTTDVFGVISDVVNINSFKIITNGKTNDIFSGIVDGRRYFLSAATAGGMTLDDPSEDNSDYVSKPILNAISASAGIVHIERGITASFDSMFSDALSGVKTLATALPPRYLEGLGTAPYTTSGISISAGSARSLEVAENQYNIVASNTFVKKLTGPFVAGTLQNGIDSGNREASTTYHTYEITDGTNVDTLFSTSATSPTLPSGYVAARRIFSFKTNSTGYIPDYTQNGDAITLTAQVLDVNGAVGPNPAALVTLSVPSGIIVKAKVRLIINSPTVGHTYSLFNALTTSAATVRECNARAYVASINCTPNEGWVTTNTASQINHISTDATDTVTLVTNGWIDTRGREN